ncbi:MAG: hypothetical protein HZB15_14455 [Actinobacteria bacterium]|nr:hypothetical protein [Actinomycetota bacterium]
MLELSWQEGGLRANVRAAGVDRDTVLQIAETTIIDVRALGLRLEGAPSGFEESPGVAIAPDDAPTTSYSWLPTDGRAGMFVNAGARPNTGLHTLDSLQATAQAPGWESSRIQLDRPGVGLLPAWVATSSANEFGRLIAITWIEGPFVLSVSGRLGLDDLQDIAEGFASADLAAVRTFRERVDAAALELPELDAAETPSGVGISVHTTGTGANVVCVRTPFARCQYTTSESSLVGDRQTAVVQTFHVDGATRVIGWAEGEHTPQLVIGDRLEPITDTARSGVGTFFVVLDPDEAAQFVFDAGDQTTGPMFGGAMTPYGATPVVVLV